ncbi:MAG: histidinol-phosphatase HisJ family protein [Epsilonproteobacteria bacterium]|nr:histidinol-phosphatase HisJ family protein [Campylobacterota bacterium]
MVDLHNHTILCNHAIGSMQEYIQQAIKKNIHIYGFADHAYMDFDQQYRMDYFQMEIYDKWIRNLQEKYPQITILKGYEVDFVPTVDTRILQQDVDYFIGSVHFLDNWGFDNPQFLSQWAQRDVDEVYKEYFDLIVQLANSGLFDIVGHLDLIKVFGFRPKEDIKVLAKEAIQAIADNDLVVEINTAGMRKKVHELYPSIALLEMIKQHDIDITFASDAHTPSQVGFYLNEAIAIAKQIGFTKVAYFVQRQKKHKKLI